METQTLLCHELFDIYAAVMAELKERGVAIAEDNPTGGYVELLVCEGLGLNPEKRNAQYKDGRDPQDKALHQIKGRRRTGKGTPHSGNLKDLEGRNFDFLTVVILDRDFAIRDAKQIPYDVVLEWAKPKSGEPNTHTLSLKREVMEDPRIKDIQKFLTPCNPDCNLDCKRRRTNNLDN